MSKRIYVGNLPYSATEDELRSVFEPHGTVLNVDILMDRMTGRPRGFGFVEMEDADALKAIEKVNGAEMGGRPLRVNEARARTEGDGRRGGGMGGGEDRRGPRY
jgi:RNA recognition motif-containing protein